MQRFGICRPRKKKTRRRVLRPQDCDSIAILVAGRTVQLHGGAFGDGEGRAGTDDWSGIDEVITAIATGRDADR